MHASCMETCMWDGIKSLKSRRRLILSLMILAFTILCWHGNDRKQLVEAAPNEPAATLEIFCQFPAVAKVRCYEKRTETAGESTVVPYNTAPVVLANGGGWRVNYGRSLFEDVMLCQFGAWQRRWNCARDLAVDTMCVWESPRSMTSNSAVFSEDRCPRCDQRNDYGDIVCDWVIVDDGLYLKEYSPYVRQSFYNRKVLWVDLDPEHWNLVNKEKVFFFSFMNEIAGSAVTVTCPEMDNYVADLPARAANAEPFVWQQEMDFLEDMDRFVTWTCDFRVVATGARCDGVNVWSSPYPQHRVGGAVKDPPCIDCAWLVDDSGLWLDQRTCFDDDPVWTFMHTWYYEFMHT